MIKTHEEYVSDLSKVNPNIEIIGKYTKSKDKTSHRCKIDGFVWDVRPDQLLYGYGCPLCAKNKTIQLRSKQHETYIQEVASIHPDIEVVATYINSHTKILHRCKIDGYEWETRPDQILSGCGCPVCAHTVIGPAPKYINSIWSSPHKEFFAQYLDEQQMKSLMPHSSHKVWVACPECGRRKQISIQRLYQYGFSCICGDGISFPNKFVFNVLNQLGVTVIPEYTPLWDGKCRYDNYLPDYHLIIENHGGQHYQECIFTRKSLEEEQKNDKRKRDVALQNGIVHYIILDCRYSTLEWIKHSILTSGLLEILRADSTSINFNMALEYASSNLVKEAANLYNIGWTVTEIMDKLMVSRSTVLRWLKDADKLNMCNYDPKRGRRTSGSRKPVMCVDTKIIYSSVSDAARCVGLKDRGGIIASCENPNRTAAGLHWQYIT